MRPRRLADTSTFCAKIAVKQSNPLVSADHVTQRIPISVYIITKNEEARIERALSSVLAWADEVIVVDSGSTDATVKIAKATSANVYHRDW